MSKQKFGWVPEAVEIPVQGLLPEPIGGVVAIGENFIQVVCIGEYDHTEFIQQTMDRCAVEGKQFRLQHQTVNLHGYVNIPRGLNFDIRYNRFAHNRIYVTGDNF